MELSSILTEIPIVTSHFYPRGLLVAAFSKRGSQGFPVLGALNRTSSPLKLAEVSHVCKYVYEDRYSKLWVGIKILNTPKGLELTGFILAGGIALASPVGFGTLTAAGILSSDYEMETFDIVGAPPTEQQVTGFKGLAP